MRGNKADASKHVILFVAFINTYSPSLYCLSQCSNEKWIKAPQLGYYALDECIVHHTHPTLPPRPIHGETVAGIGRWKE